MEQNGQNNGYHHNMYGHGDPAFENGIDFNNNAIGSIQHDNPTSPLSNVYPTMGIPLNASATMDNHDVAFGVGSEVSNPNGLYGGTNSAFVSNDQPIAGAADGPRPNGARGLLRAHAVGPARSINSRNAALHHPYGRPQPGTSQSQLQTEVRRNTSRRAGPAVGRSMQTGRNAFTRPRRQLNAGQSQSQPEMTHAQGNMSASGHMKTSSGSSSSSISPVGSNNVDDQASAAVGVPPAPSNEHVRPIYETVESTRVDPAGPDPHPNADWRAPGPAQWTVILHRYRDLQHMSDASIKDLLRHCETLVNSGVPDPSNPDSPALLPGSRYTVLDAQTVWNYCTAYSKRRQQLRNNSAASKSRNSKAAQLKHWKAMALAGGAANHDFIFDANDPANAPGADATHLSAVTQAAIQEMMQNWTQNGAPGGQGAVANPVPGLAPIQPPQTQVNQSQTQHQFNGQLQNISSASASAVAAPAVSTAPDTTNPYQQDQSDVFEDFKQELPPVADDFLDQLKGVDYGHEYAAGADFLNFGKS